MSEGENAFSIEECQQILDSCFSTTPVRYIRHEFRSLSDDVEGYLSEHYSLEIYYEDSDNKPRSRKFFVKCILNQKGFLATFARALDVFRKESFLYTYLFKEFEQFSIFKRLAPRIHLCKDSVLVLEDLTVDGYKTAERLKLFNMEQCKAALKTIAYNHAYSIVVEELKSKETGTKYRLNIAFPEEFEEKFYGDLKSSPTAKFLDSSIQCLLDIIDVLPANMYPDKEEFKRLVKEDTARESTLEKDQERYRFTCVHGDLWANNIMFKHNKEGQVLDCKLIDFQMMRYCLPAYDVELFFYGNTSAEFRAEHKDELLQYYYKSLRRALEENSIDIKEIMSYADLLDTCILKSAEAKIQAISDMSLLYLPEELHLQATIQPDFYKTVLIDERSKFVLDVYESNAEFRQIITEELIDLRLILEAKERFLKNH